nr:glycosyltransferase [Octadecabacter algicola]
MIGRNEGDRLKAALAALPKDISRAVYVDSGSTDGSLDAAKAAGVDGITLDLSSPFTAARARNTGVAHLLRSGPRPDFIQFIDGDCALDPNWTVTALAAITADPKRAVVCGRRRERYPDDSVYNWLIDREWNSPVGIAKACGGDALIRLDAFEVVGGYPDDMIAGEEPEMCVRLRQAGWTIERIEAEMTLHDAAITTFSQWWRRARRAGHAYAEGAHRHGAKPERHKVTETRRALAWGLLLPLAIVLGALMFGPVALFGLLIWPLQILRQKLKGRPWAEAFFQTIGKFPETSGILEFHWKRLRGGSVNLIEYK